MNKITVGNYTRISKRAARAAYNAGQIVRLCACNMSPLNVWGACFDIRLATSPVLDPSHTFDRTVNSFTLYNCNSETGRYPAYYVCAED